MTVNFSDSIPRHPLCLLQLSLHPSQEQEVSPAQLMDRSLDCEVGVGSSLGSLSVNISKQNF